MTQAQLLTLIDSIYTTNGVGDITGLEGNTTLKEIVNSIYAEIASVAGTIPAVAVDDKTVELNNVSELAAKLATYNPAVFYNPANPYAFVIKFEIPGTAYAGGMFIKVDGKSIGVVDGSLSVLGGVGGKMISTTYAVADDFIDPLIGGDLVNAYLSTDGVNGYLKLDTLTAANTASIVKTEKFDGSLSPGFAIKAKFPAPFVSASIALGLIDSVTALSATTKGFYFTFDKATQTNWQVVLGDGVAAVTVDTGIAFDNDEHVFQSSMSGTSVVFLIDDVEVHSASLTLASSPLLLSVQVDSPDANPDAAIVDYVTASQIKVEETSPTFSTVPALINMAEKRYIAMFTQIGTNAPTEDILIAELGVPVLTRTGVGEYVITLASAFSAARTIPTFRKWEDGAGSIFELNRVDENSFTLKSKNAGLVLTDSLLVGTPIDIRVYAQNSTPPV
jgi:hypothetical protein